MIFQQKRHQIAIKIFFSNAHKEEQNSWHEIFIFLLSRKQQKKKKDLQWMVIQLSIYVLIWTFLTYVYLFLLGKGRNFSNTQDPYIDGFHFLLLQTYTNNERFP